MIIITRVLSFVINLLLLRTRGREYLHATACVPTTTTRSEGLRDRLLCPFYDIISLLIFQSIVFFFLLFIDNLTNNDLSALEAPYWWWACWFNFRRNDYHWKSKWFHVKIIIIRIVFIRFCQKKKKKMKLKKIFMYFQSSTIFRLKLVNFLQNFRQECMKIVNILWKISIF